MPIENSIAFHTVLVLYTVLFYTEQAYKVDFIANDSSLTWNRKTFHPYMKTIFSAVL